MTFIKTEPKSYKSDITEKEYPYDEYRNHGYGGVKLGFKDLPHDEYPYSIIYEDPIIPMWSNQP